MAKSDYWEKRQSNTMQSIYNAQERKTVSIVRLYKDTQRELEDMIAQLYAKYSQGGELSYTELHKYNRMKNLYAEIDNKINDLGKKEVKQITNDLKDNYREAYSKVDTMLTKSVSLEIKTVGVNEKAVERAVTYPWSGAQFSDRVWDNKTNMGKKVKQVITNGIVQGKSVTNMTREFKSLMGKEAYECRRLVRTETANVVNSATIDRYKDGGIETVEWITAEDERVCDECGPMHGEVFDVGKAPHVLHPNCRCTIIPIVE